MDAQPKKKLVVGILAHVDAGKTTLSEALLYLSGRIRKLGRVDHGDTFLDTNPLERERGITIFSKSARFSTDRLDVVLLDTPGHVDFSAETERTLQVLDYAILVVSATDGVQNHTLTLWQLLRTYHVPTFVFINKIDLENPGEAALAGQLAERLDPACFACFTGEDSSARAERLASLSDELMEAFFDGEDPDDGVIAELVAGRKLFPCFFGSALRMSGVEEFLDGLARWTLQPSYPEAFGARVYKISRDSTTSGHGARLTWMKITGGALNVRDGLRCRTPDGAVLTEKAAQLRLYSGEKYTQTDTVTAGEIVCVVGLTGTFAGEGLGDEPDASRPVLEPVLNYRVNLPPGCDVRLFYPKLKQLEEEDPALHLVWREETREIHAQLMGEVQTEVLTRLIRERFGVEASFDAGRILYKETIRKPVEGIGHFEPLRHYAEVHLLLEPLPPGSGMVFDTRCPDSMLARNWQSVILSHLWAKVHCGVLTCSPLTDMKITLVAGRAHQVHTDGGDFREAAWRAVRQGVMSAESVLLEPIWRFTLTLPSAQVGRAANDLTLRGAEFVLGDSDGLTTVVTGRVPAASLGDYAREVQTYTRGEGRLSVAFDGYAPCHNADEVIAAIGYNPEGDLANTPHSIFCGHGAGFVVPWNRVREYMHITSYPARDRSADADDDAPLLPSAKKLAGRYDLSDDELEAIMTREFGPIKRRQYKEPVRVVAQGRERTAKPVRRVLIIDGYNVIFQWESLRELAKDDLSHARDRLMDLLANYVAFTKTEVTLVFDAYHVPNSQSRSYDRDGYHVVYTSQDETADAFIERKAHELGPSYSVRVVTSDRLIQVSALAAGVARMSAREFEEEILRISAEITEFIQKLTIQNGLNESALKS